MRAEAGAKLGAADAAVLDRWWRTFVATGAVPGELELVQARLVRAVHRGALPSGPVHVKAMTFPRAKDRLRYALRRLPAAHEAAMLRLTAAAGIPCPQVLAVRTLRRAGLPHRSLLVLRSLPTDSGGAGAEDPVRRLRDAAVLAVRLLAAGIVHRDLHDGNFVRLRDGGLAVVDLQSARRSPAARRGARRLRLALAARLVRERGAASEWGSALLTAGLLRTPAEVADVAALCAAEVARFRRSRIARCLGDSTEFVRQVHWWGTEHRLRAGLGGGRWWRGGASLRRAWIGQRIRQVDQGAAMVFPGFFRKWWWLGGGSGLYVPAACSDERIEVEVRTASAAFDRAWSARPSRGKGRSGDGGGR